VAEKLFSITAADFDWAYTRGTGKGGQKRNKTSSAVHCSHRPSGAHGYAEDSRSQHDNRQLAFERCTSSTVFKTWLHLETLRRAGTMAQIDATVEQELRRVKVEIKRDGRWVEVGRDAVLQGDTDNGKD
jgi:protein subunit release factor B